MARKQRDEGGGYNYMDTYGDLVTLLLAFFVMLFAMSSINESKWEMLVKAFSGKGNETQQMVLSPEGEGNDIAINKGTASPEDTTINIESLPATFNELYKYIKAFVEQNQMQGSVTVEKSGDNVVYIRFQDNLFFQADSAWLMPDSTGILEFMGKCLKNVEPQVMMVRVNGHTADPGIANYRISDRTLSTDRANSIVAYLEDKMKIASKKLMAQGYGKNFPIADNSTAEGRQKNRRVELMILSNDVLGSTPEELDKLLNASISADLFNDHTNSAGMLIPPDIQVNGENVSGTDAGTGTTTGAGTGTNATTPPSPGTTTPPSPGTTPVDNDPPRQVEIVVPPPASEIPLPK